MRNNMRREFMKDLRNGIAVAKSLRIGLCLVATLFAAAATAEDISAGGWRLVLDQEAKWEKDKLYLPEEAEDLSKLPYNPPTGGWGTLHDNAGIAVELPATVEGYYWEKMIRKPYRDDSINYFEGVHWEGFRMVGGFRGVSWWYKTIEIPEFRDGQRILLNFRAARFRAEVFLNEKLVGYSSIAEVPFSCDVTKAAVKGKNKLAVRITSPGGNYNWTDFTSTWGGTTAIPQSHGFGGLDSGITLEVRDDSYVEDFAILNKQQLGDFQIQADIHSVDQAYEGKMEVIIRDAAGAKVFGQEYPVKTEAGKTAVFNFDAAVPNVKAWDIDTPVLYTATARLIGKPQSQKDIRFGFRTYKVAGIGENARLEVNGHRVVIKGMISWGYWGPNGLFPGPELALKGVKAAKALGLNCMNWHRNLGNPLSMDATDEQGVFVFEEPGSGMHAFESHQQQLYYAARYMAHKIWRMVRRDRNHPSVIHFNMANEMGTECTDEFDKRVFNEIHRLAPDRSITLISGVNLDSSEWKKDVYERNQAAMRPWDDTIYEARDGRKYPGQSERSSRNAAGWYSEHSVNGAGVWKDFRYQGKDNFWHKARNEKGQIMEWGEMGGFGSPDQFGKAIKWYEEKNGNHGYGLRDARRIYTAYKEYIKKYGFDQVFKDPDDVFFAAGNKAYSTWSKVMEVARLSDENDILTGNGWDSTVFDNHSGLVDGLRNFKGDPKLMAEGLQPLMISVMPHRFIVPQGGEAVVDFWILNEKDLKGDYTLQATAKTPAGKPIRSVEQNVSLEGGIRFSQLLLENAEFEMPEAGLATVEARLVREGKTVLERVVPLHVVDYRIQTDKKVYLVEDEDEVKKGLDALGIRTVDTPEQADVIVFSTKTSVSARADRKPIAGDVFKKVAEANLMGTYFKLDGFPNGPTEIEFTFPKMEQIEPRINIDVNRKRVVQDLAYDRQAAAKAGEIALFTHTVKVEVTDGKIQIKAAEVNRSEVIQRNYIDEPRRNLDPQNFLVAVRITDAQGKAHRYAADYQDVTDKDGNVWKGALYNPQRTLDDLVTAAKKNHIPLIAIYDHNRAQQGASLPGKQNAKDGDRANEPWMGGWYFTRKHKLLDGLPVGDVMDWKYQAATTYGQDHFYADMGGSAGHGQVFDAQNLDVAVAIGADHQSRPGHVAATWTYEGVPLTMINMPQFVRACAAEGWGFNHWIALKMLGNAIR